MGGFRIFPELSNSGSLPGKAGGLPSLIKMAKEKMYGMIISANEME